MTQPAPVTNTSETSPSTQPEQPAVPRISHVIEHSIQTIRVVDENGVRKTVIEHQVNSWVVGQPVPTDSGGDSKKPVTKIEQIFRLGNGDYRIYVRPTEGSDAQKNGICFRMTIPARVIAFSAEIMPASIFDDEIADDEDELLFGGAGGEGGGDPEPSDTNGATNGAPVPPQQAIGEG